MMPLPIFPSLPSLSYWYWKDGAKGGVLNWTARSDEGYFTGGNKGLRALVDATGWKIIAHNRYWSAATNYALQNGGPWPFFIDPANDTNHMAVPLTQAFWGSLLGSSVVEWGLTTYEQGGSAAVHALARGCVRASSLRVRACCPLPLRPPSPTLFCPCRLASQRARGCQRAAHQHHPRAAVAHRNGRWCCFSGRHHAALHVLPSSRAAIC